jgi:hypothetical protein
LLKRIPHGPPEILDVKGLMNKPQVEARSFQQNNRPHVHEKPKRTSSGGVHRYIAKVRK